MKSISVVMTYYNRPAQLRNTLRSIKPYWDDSNTELIIVDDGSDPGQDAIPVVKDLKFPAKVIPIPKHKKTWINPSVPYNMGFKAAEGDVVLLQNSECLWIGNLFWYIRTYFEEDRYLVFNCFCSSPQQFQEICNIGDSHFFQEDVYSVLPDNKDHREMWYHHCTLRPTHYHFATAIDRRKLMEDIGGFDERFAHGYCFEDNALLLAIKRSNLKIVDIPSECFVVHQWHPKNAQYYGGCSEWENNRRLYQQILEGSV